MNEQAWGLRRKKLLLVAAAAIVLASSVGALILHTDKDPYSSTAVEISNLLPLVKELQETPDTNNTGKSTRSYIRSLQAVKQHCKQVQEYNKTTITLKLDETKRSILNQSKDLCADLAKLADYSLGTYGPIEPLLGARTTARKYETFGPLSTNIKQRHLGDTKDALSALKQAAASDIDFPSGSRKELEKLQTAIQDSKGLAYLPSLYQFQMNLLAERQRFWGPYANGAQLTKSLQSQLDAYCHTLADDKSRPNECKQH